MDPPAFNQLLIVTKEQFENVRKSYNVTRESLQADIDNLISWYSQQPHLPSIKIDPEWVERILIMNKCSLERAKKRLDMIFTSRTIMDLFQNRDPERGLQMIGSTIKIIPLPRLMSDYTRIFLIKVTKNSENFDFFEFLKVLFMFFEYRQHHDYSIGDQYITDMTNMSMSHYVKFTPGLIKKSEIINKEVFGFRIAGLHQLFPGALLEKILILMKMVLSKKLSDRIQVHTDLSSLHRVIQKDILPKDYGGDEASSDEIFDKWRDEICSPKQVKWFKAQGEIKSDESKRIGESVTDEMLGIPGSFRKLIVD